MIRIKEGKFYRDRMGRKWGPLTDMGGYWSLESYGGGHNPGHYSSDGISAFCGKAGGREPEREQYDLVAEWGSDGNGPVRTITMKEIVPGTYGPIRMDWSRAQKGVLLFDLWKANLSPDELRSLSSMFTELADALEHPAPELADGSE